MSSDCEIRTGTCNPPRTMSASNCVASALVKVVDWHETWHGVFREARTSRADRVSRRRSDCVDRLHDHATVGRDGYGERDLSQRDCDTDRSNPGIRPHQSVRERRARRFWRLREQSVGLGEPGVASLSLGIPRIDLLAS